MAVHGAPEPVRSFQSHWGRDWRLVAEPSRFESLFLRGVRLTTASTSSDLSDLSRGEQHRRTRCQSQRNLRISAENNISWFSKIKNLGLVAINLILIVNF